MNRIISPSLLSADFSIADVNEFPWGGCSSENFEPAPAPEGEEEPTNCFDFVDYTLLDESNPEANKT